MAERHGGMRRPQNPAPVSGPGQLSQRTDGGPQQTLADMSGMPYGENQAMDAIQSAAPLSASGQTSARASRTQPRGRGGAAQGGMGVTPLFAPTQRPDEPVTAGAPFGPGDGPTMQPQSSGDPDMQMLKEYLPDLEIAARFDRAPKTFKMLVAYLRNA